MDTCQKTATPKGSWARRKVLHVIHRQRTNLHDPMFSQSYHMAVRQANLTTSSDLRRFETKRCTQRLGVIQDKSYDHRT